jgi:hypothetical protein
MMANKPGNIAAFIEAAAKSDSMVREGRAT